MPRRHQEGTPETLDRGPDGQGPGLEHRLAKEPLLRLLAWNLLSGFGVALALVLAVFAFDIGHLRSLILGAEDPLVPVLLLVFGFVVTFGSVTMGTAIMALGAEPRDRDPGNGRKAPIGGEAPILAAVVSRRPGGR